MLWTESLKREQRADPYCKRLVAGLELNERDDLDANLQSPFKLIEGVLWRRGEGETVPVTTWRAVLPPRLRYSALLNALAGHLGFDKTLRRVQARFYWKGMCEDTKQWVTSFPHTSFEMVFGREARMRTWSVRGRRCLRCVPSTWATASGSSRPP